MDLARELQPALPELPCSVAMLRLSNPGAGAPIWAVHFFFNALVDLF